ncbi:hypothetical protein CH375_05125 [Leptospira ellisii]|nr:hypothetical protein CH375_05125 [Leptospira ellisii]
MPIPVFSGMTRVDILLRILQKIQTRGLVDFVQRMRRGKTPGLISVLENFRIVQGMRRQLDLQSEKFRSRFRSLFSDPFQDRFVGFVLSRFLFSEREGEVSAVARSFGFLFGKRKEGGKGILVDFVV